MLSLGAAKTQVLVLGFSFSLSLLLFLFLFFFFLFLSWTHNRERVKKTSHLVRCTHQWGKMYKDKDNLKKILWWTYWVSNIDWLRLTMFRFITWKLFFVYKMYLYTVLYCNFEIRWMFLFIRFLFFRLSISLNVSSRPSDFYGVQWSVVPSVKLWMDTGHALEPQSFHPILLSTISPSKLNGLPPKEKRTVLQWVIKIWV